MVRGLRPRTSFTFYVDLGLLGHFNNHENHKIGAHTGHQTSPSMDDHLNFDRSQKGQKGFGGGHDINDRKRTNGLRLEMRDFKNLIAIFLTSFILFYQMSSEHYFLHKMPLVLTNNCKNQQLQ